MDSAEGFVRKKRTERTPPGPETRRSPVNARSLACMLALMGVVGGAARSQAAPAPAAHEVSYATLERGAWGQWSRPALVAAGSDCEWAGQMEQITKDGGLIAGPAPKAPALDWS